MLFTAVSLCVAVSMVVNYTKPMDPGPGKAATEFAEPHPHIVKLVFRMIVNISFEQATLDVKAEHLPAGGTMLATEY